VQNFGTRIAEYDRKKFAEENSLLIKAALIGTADRCLADFVRQVGQFHLDQPLANSKLVHTTHQRMFTATVADCWSTANKYKESAHYAIVEAAQFLLPCKEKQRLHSKAAAERVRARISQLEQVAKKAATVLEVTVGQSSSVRGRKECTEYVSAALAALANEFTTETSNWHDDSSEGVVGDDSDDGVDGAPFLFANNKNNGGIRNNAYAQALGNLNDYFLSTETRVRDNNLRRATETCTIHMRAAQFKLEDLLNALHLPMDENNLVLEFIRAKTTAEAQYDQAVQHLSDYPQAFGGCRANISASKQEIVAKRNIASLRYAFNTPVGTFLEKASKEVDNYRTLFFFKREMKALLKNEIKEYIGELALATALATATSTVTSTATPTVTQSTRYQLDLDSPLADAWIDNVLRTDLAAEYGAIKSRFSILVFNLCMAVSTVCLGFIGIYKLCLLCWDSSKRCGKECRRRLCCGLF
jgi:hypothetical protein